MAAFHPATIQAQRDLLDKTIRDLDRDRRMLDRQPPNSKSKMADRLRGRIAESLHVGGDLEHLIRFMEALNAEQPDAIPAARTRAEWAVLTDAYFAAQMAGDAVRDGEPAAADLTTAMARYSSSHGTTAVYDTADPHDAALAELARAEEPLTVDFGREPNNWAPRYGSRDEDGA